MRIATVMNSEHSALIAALSAAPDDTAFAHLLHAGGQTLLSDPAAIVDIAALAIGPEDGEDARMAAALLSRALDEARMADENGLPKGPALIGSLNTYLSGLDADHPFPPALRLRLAQVYARAGLVPPPFAILGAGPADAGEAMPDLEDLLGPILKEAVGEALQAHGALSELLAGLPEDLAAMLVAMIVARPGAVEARLGLYWCLDPRPDLRLAAATSLLSRAETGDLPASDAALLPTLRKWLPGDGARDALDAVIRRQMRVGSARAVPTAITMHRAAISLPDGAGAQSLVAAVQQGSRRGVAMAMLKQGHGVKDAFILPCGSASEQKRLLARVLEEIETFDVQPAALASALSQGIGEGLTLARLPAPGLVDLAELFGSGMLAPADGDAAGILATTRATEQIERLSAPRRTALIRHSETWMGRFGQADSWFEDNGDLRAAISRARTEKGQETAVWKHLETRRAWWARHFAMSAAVLQASGAEDWLSFAAVAEAVLKGTSLKRIPIMEDIADQTLDAFLDRADPAPVTEGKDAAALLAQAGVSAAYLDGYVTALVVAPTAPSPDAWLGVLLGGIEFPGEGAIDRIMARVAMATDRAEDAAADAGNMNEKISALDEDALRDWAAGFTDLVKSTKSCWPAKALKADDKRILRDIGNTAEGAETGTLRSVLPAWIARRHAIRQ